MNRRIPGCSIGGEGQDSVDFDVLQSLFLCTSGTHSVPTFVPVRHALPGRGVLQPPGGCLVGESSLGGVVPI